MGAPSQFRNQQMDLFRIFFKTPITIRISFSPARAAFFRTTSIGAGSMQSGRLTLEMADKPRSRSPQWTATITSGIVDIPTASAPIIRRKRVSAGVSMLGPVTPT